MSEVYIGAFNGFSVRQGVDSTLVSLTDLYKACSSPASLRTDKWLRSEEVQARLRQIAETSKLELEVDKSGVILQIPGILEVIRGGARKAQGTFANHDLALFYASALSDDCYNWLFHVLNGARISQENDEVIKAKKATITVGTFTLSVFQLPDGSYRLSQTEVSNTVFTDETNFRDFLASNSPEALPYKGFKFGKVKAKGEKGRPANAIPVSLAVAFWIKQGISGNEKAVRLLGACAVETIERRADKAFGVHRTEEEYNQRFDQVFQLIISSYPAIFSLYSNKQSIRVSVYGAAKKQIKKNYPEGVIIKGIKGKSQLLKEIVYLSSSCTPDFWRLTTQRELTYKLGELSPTKYPDAITGRIPVGSGRNKQEAVFIFQFFDPIVDYQDVEECALKRQYVQLAREALKIDHVFLFFVSPLGATSHAHAFIQDRLPGGENGCDGYVGALTAKELTQFYVGQALTTKITPLARGRITKGCRNLLNYEIRINPLSAIVSDNYQQLNLFE